MNNLIGEVYGAISASLRKTQYTGEISDTKLFTKTVVGSGMVGFIYEYLDLSKFEEKYKKILTQTYYHFIKRDTTQQLLIKRIKDIYKNQDIDYIFLKGAHLKSIYPKTYYRGMTDVDVLIYQKHYKKANKILKKHDFKCIEKYYFHNTYVYKNENEHLELHPFIQHDFDHKYDGLFKSPFENVLETDDNEKQFTHEYELVYLLYHLAKHVQSSGIGIRSLLDIYLYTKTFDLNEQVLSDLLIKTQLKKFYELIIGLHQFYLDDKFDMKNFNFNQYSEEDFIRILEDVIHTGMHGKAANDTYERMLSAMDINSFKDKVKYLMRTSFPSYRKVSRKYDVIKYIPILLPFYWVIRIIRLLIVNARISFGKVFSLIKKKEQKNIDKNDYYL